MDDALRNQINALNDALLDADDTVTRLVEAENRPLAAIDECHQTVERIAAEYGALRERVSEPDRAGLERSLGRRVTDLRRHAAQLPARVSSSGKTVAKAADALPEGGWPMFEQRAPGKSLTEFAPPRRDDPAVKVGRDIEAWCGKCGEVRDHTVVAMVGGQPKQVVCRACGSRHAYRTGPARRPAAPTAPARTPARTEGDAYKREDARRQLVQELAGATTVREFVKRERYKVGEIIDHPEHGRGKIENVLRSSLLVRFRDGLKSLSLL